MKIEKCVLQELLQVFGKVVRSESVVEEYKSVWFVGIPGSFQVEAVATDGEQYVSVTVEATDDKEINFAVPFAELEQRAAECQGNELEIEGKFLALPEIPSPPVDAVTAELPDGVGALLMQAATVVQSDEKSKILRGINVSKYGITAATSMMLLHLPCALTWAQDVTLPVPPFALPAEEKGSLHIWGDSFQMQIGNVKWRGKILEGEFPDWRNIVCENKPFETTIKFKQSEELINWMKNIPAQEKDDWIVFNCLSYTSLELTAYRQDDIKFSLAPRIEGIIPQMVFSVDRNVLLKTLQFGYTTLKLRDPLNPVTFSGANGYCVVMPRRIENTFRTVGGKRGKLFGTIFACIALLLLFAAGKTFLKSGVERFVEKQIQQCANRLTGRDVYVGSVSYDLWKQRVEIRKLSVPNPQGYSQKVPAIYVDRIAMELMPWEIFKNLLHIRELKVTGVMINAELKRYPKKFKELVEILRSPEVNLIDLKSASKRKTENVPAAKRGVFIRIDKLQITDAVVSSKCKWRIGFTLPDYLRENIGKDGKLTTDQLAAEVYNYHLQEMQLKVLRKAQEIKAASEKTIGDLVKLIKEKYGKRKNSQK